MAACQLFPQAEGQNDEGSTGDGEHDAEGKPASAIAAKIQELRQEQDDRKERTNANCEPGNDGFFLLGSDRVEVVLITLRSSAVQCFSTARGKNKTNSLEAAVRLGVFRPSIPRMRAKARRRCGMVTERRR